jgi:hypothetical protein
MLRSCRPSIPAWRFGSSTKRFGRRDESTRAKPIAEPHLPTRARRNRDSKRYPRLDSTSLAPGIRREIRVYTGFGLGGNHMLRLRQGDAGVDGHLGSFWTIGQYITTYDSRAEERAGRAKGRAYGAQRSALPCASVASS